MAKKITQTVHTCGEECPYYDPTFIVQPVYTPGCLELGRAFTEQELKQKFPEKCPLETI